MERRVVLFVVLSVASFFVWTMAMRAIHPRPKPEVAKDDKPDGKQGDKPGGKKPPVDKVKNGEQDPERPNPDKPEPKKPKVEPEVDVDPQWVMLGSADPASKYRMLVTLTNQGAAVQRIELNEERFRDIDDRSGYLGDLTVAADARGGGGCLLRAIGTGTPADAAKLQPGDIITGFTSEKVVGATIANSDALVEALNKTKPGETISLTVSRDGANVPVQVELGRRPLELIRPEKDQMPVPVVKAGNHDPLSLLLSLDQIGDEKLGAVKDDEDGDEKDKKAAKKNLLRELEGAALAKARWEVVKSTPDEAEFRRKLPQHGMAVIKRFQLAQIEADADQPAYHLTLDVEIENTGDETQEIAYRLDGPNGLPTEGAWYATRVHRNWGADGLRSVEAFTQERIRAWAATEVVGAEKLDVQRDFPLAYAGVASQYFAVILMPKTGDAKHGLWEFAPVMVGEKSETTEGKRLANVSSRLISNTVKLKAGEKLAHTYQVFAGPKKPSVLGGYENDGITLEGLQYYGWWPWSDIARLMAGILQVFYSVVGNYGIAIILLTVVVRGAMHPLSRKQARSAQKMQELKPEMDRINQQHKANPQERQKAMHELFRKHNYNPLGGCLLIFLQLPVFLGLYKALAINIELRQAPLISDAVRWCSNLGAPDMLWYWRGIMPEFLTRDKGFLSLGPYLNILPLITIALFIWQQKMFMPPPTDDQTRMQQKMMKYMMIAMGFLFFTVPSGLCIYFIASSLWGIAERKMLPTHTPGTPTAAAPGAARVTSGGGKSSDNGAAVAARKELRKKRQKGRN